MGAQPAQRELKARLALEIMRYGSLDYSAAEPPARRRLHRRSAVLAPLDCISAELIKARGQLHTSSTVGQGAILRGIGDHFMHHQRDRSERLGRDQRVRPFEDQALGLASDIRGSLSLEERVEGPRAPMFGGDLVVRAREGLDAATHECSERFDRMARLLALGDYAPDQAQDVPDAVIELCDQEFLALLSSPPLLGCDIAQM